MPSIPARSLEPPEDKLAAQADGFVENVEKKTPLPSYMTEFEGQRNPVVSPFSYSPRVISKNQHNQQFWGNSSQRFNPSNNDSKSNTSSLEPHARSTHNELNF